MFGFLLYAAAFSNTAFFVPFFAPKRVSEDRFRSGFSMGIEERNLASSKLPEVSRISLVLGILSSVIISGSPQVPVNRSDLRLRLSEVWLLGNELSPWLDRADIRRSQERTAEKLSLRLPISPLDSLMFLSCDKVEFMLMVCITGK